MDTQTKAAERLVIDTLTLRDYFAGQYMAAAIERASTISAGEYERLSKGNGGWSKEQIAATLAYRYADSMLIQRERR